MLCDLAPAHVRAIAPYQPGKPIGELAREIGIAEGEIIKLASNENPLGASPKAIAAVARALPDLALYPDGSGYALKGAIAERCGTIREQVILGNGSNDVLELVARTFLTPSDSAIYAQHAFAVYPLVVQAIGARGIEVPARHYGSDLDALAGAIEANTKIIFLANPNNPTGTFVPLDALHAWLKRLPPRVLVVLDEAYGEYLEPELRGNTPGWLKTFPQLIISRTLSKAYGLAGLRVGYGLASAELIDLMNRVRQPFNVNCLAQEAAIAALGDEAFLAESRALNSAGMRQLEQGFAARNLDYIPSLGNFIAVRVGPAGRVYQSLLHQGVIVRPVAGYGMPEHLRVSIGTAEQNARFLAALDQALAAVVA
jgi:histidinol-phosphate aminotransferase